MAEVFEALNSHTLIDYARQALDKKFQRIITILHSYVGVYNYTFDLFRILIQFRIHSI